MKIINWIAYLFYKFFLKCGKDDWDARHTAKLFTGVFVGFVLIGVLVLVICINHPEYRELYFTPINAVIIGLLVIAMLDWYYWNRWDARMKDIDAIYNSWSDKKQKWMLAVPILADIISLGILFIAYNIVKYFY